MIDYKLGDVLLTVDNLNVSYNGISALHNINFSIRDIIRTDKIQGQCIAILGRSGSGKSTLFKALSGFHDLSEKNGCSGSVKIGKDLHKVKMGEVGVVPQDYPLLAHRTIYNNLNIALFKDPKEKVNSSDNKKLILEYADYFGLTPHLEKFPSQLSGGQRQRCAILQQILAGSTFILLDEPFSGLDCLMKDKVTEILIKASDIREENTLLIVSHDIESACAIADHVYVIGNDGKSIGSTILKTYDFLEMDLAYHADIKEQKLFREVIKEIKSIM